MDRQNAERITTEYAKPIFGFALKRCKNWQDAEDLSQDIAEKVFRALLNRNDIDNIEKFIWTIAHHALSNYYRDIKKHLIGLSMEEAAKILCSGDSNGEADWIKQETTACLQSEIAHLSKLHRRIIIAYYYENKKQKEIAEECCLPLGTVKWHLFEARKDLKRGLETMRQASELKFNPVQFTWCGTNGIIGSKGANTNFFRSALSQNIAYTVWKEPKTVNEIADALGVSPVYVESEAAFLEEYAFLQKHGDRYLCNILIEEKTEELNRLHDAVYTRAAKLFANELYSELMESDIWESSHIGGGVTSSRRMDSPASKDKTFFLWGLIPYIAAVSGEKNRKLSVSFEEAATLRPDGGQNICCATILNPNAAPPAYSDSMKKWYGPSWFRQGDMTLWRIDSEWSGNRMDERYLFDTPRILTLLHQEKTGTVLSEEDYAYLTELGLIKRIERSDSSFETAYSCIWIEGTETKNRLIAFGDALQERYQAEFENLKKEYSQAVLRETPEHLRKMATYGLQHLFYADAWFILHCLKELVHSGKLKLPAQEQQKAMSTLIFHE